MAKTKKNTKEGVYERGVTMTDEQIIFRWQRSTKDFNACRVLAHLSQRKIMDIIHLICISGYMGPWVQVRKAKKVEKSAK